MVKYIYWHRVRWIDRQVFRKFKINQVIGFLRKETSWEILNKECTGIEAYIKFEYLGRTIRTGDGKKDKKEFNKLMSKIADKTKNLEDGK